MKTPFEILLEKLNGRRNPNSYTILWDNETLPTGTTWSTGYDTYDIIPFEWGFQLIADNGRIAPPTKISFGKYTTDADYNDAFKRAMDFIRKNCSVSQGLPPYLWGD